MTEERGKIYSLEAYAQSKMLDHSAWQTIEPRLPRRITASDMDALFIHPTSFNLDNNGSIIYGELTRGEPNWQVVRKGQRKLYEAAITSGLHCAALCQHGVDKERQICTRTDIIAFQIMLYDFEPIFCRPFIGNKNWQRFILRWFTNARELRRWLLGRSIGMKTIPV
jgi:hypothetical protein